MRKIVYALMFFLYGCSQTSYWLKDGGSQNEFNKTQSACHNQAYFLPNSVAPQSLPNYLISAQAQNFGGVTATATPFKNPYQALGDGLSSLGASIDNIVRREQYVRNCMIANGWREVSSNDISLTVDTYARVGSNPMIEYNGNATGYIDGSGTINIVSTDNNQCVGTFRYNETFTSGTGVVRCDDGDSAQITFKSITNSSGFGKGLSENGKPIRFVYGVPKEKREPYFKSE